MSRLATTPMPCCGSRLGKALGCVPRDDREDVQKIVESKDPPDWCLARVDLSFS